MRKSAKFIWILFSFIGQSFAQTGTEVLPRGARSMGMGNAHVTIGDAWAVFNNIGGLAQVEQSQAFFGYDHRMGLSELTTLAAGAVLKMEQGVMGLGVSTFGSELFSQSQIGLGYSNQLGIASLGVKVDYFQTSIEGFGTGGSLMVSFGGVAELGPHLLFGAYVHNVNRARYGKNTEDRLPTFIQSGLSYRPSDKLMVNLEAEKELLLPGTFKLGLEYNLLHRIWTRVGLNTHPSKFFFGIGFRPKRFHVDYAMNQHPVLGETHHFSFNYLFLGK